MKDLAWGKETFPYLSLAKDLDGHVQKWTCNYNISALIYALNILFIMTLTSIHTLFSFQVGKWASQQCGKIQSYQGDPPAVCRRWLNHACFPTYIGLEFEASKEKMTYLIVGFTLGRLMLYHIGDPFYKFVQDWALNDLWIFLLKVSVTLGNIHEIGILPNDWRLMITYILYYFSYLI